MRTWALRHIPIPMLRWRIMRPVAHYLSRWQWKQINKFSKEHPLTEAEYQELTEAIRDA